MLSPWLNQNFLPAELDKFLSEIIPPSPLLGVGTASSLSNYEYKGGPEQAPTLRSCRAGALILTETIL
jgi:hypothetical protein